MTPIEKVRHHIFWLVIKSYHISLDSPIIALNHHFDSKASGTLKVAGGSLCAIFCVRRIRTPAKGSLDDC